MKDSFKILSLLRFVTPIYENIGLVLFKSKSPPIFCPGIGTEEKIASYQSQL